MRRRLLFIGQVLGLLAVLPASASATHLYAGNASNNLMYALNIGSNTVSAVSVDRFGRRSKASADIKRCSTSAAFTG